MGEDLDPIAGLWGDALNIEGDYQLGHTVSPLPSQPPGSGLAGAPVDLVWAYFTRPVPFTLYVSSNVGAGAVSFYVTTWMGQGVSYRRGPFKAGVFPRPVRGFGTQVQVQAFTTVPAGGVSATGLITPTQVDAMGDVFPVWAPGEPGLVRGTNVIGTANNPAAGKLLKYKGYLATFGGTDTGPYWVQFFDSPAEPASGIGIQPLDKWGPLTVNATFAVDDTIRPSMFFDSALSWYLSQNPTVYVAASVGATALVDVVYGQ